ncbi:unnamed protein product [Discosporangium mesarthrocarpum]
MGNIMGRPRRHKRRGDRTQITDQDRAVLDLKNARDRLQKYQKRLDKESTRLQSQALTLVKEGRKDKALLLLKIKKFKQEQANKADGQLLGVMQMMDNIEWGSQQLKVFDALKSGNLALDRLHKEMPLEQVEELMADTAESIAMSEEISRAIGGSWTDANEEDLLKEFDDLQVEMAKEAAAQGVAAATVPQQAPAPVQEASEVAPVVVAVAVAGGEGGVQGEQEALASLLPDAPMGAVHVKPVVVGAGAAGGQATALPVERKQEMVATPLPA